MATRQFQNLQEKRNVSYVFALVETQNLTKFRVIDGSVMTDRAIQYLGLFGSLGIQADHMVCVKGDVLRV